MQKQIFTTEDVAQFLADSMTMWRSKVYQGTTEQPFKVQVMTLDLATAKLSTAPYKIGFPFKSIYVQDATDTTVAISMLAGTMNSYQSAFTLKKNDAWSSDGPISEAYLYWSAQAGKTATIVFFVDSEFRSGSQISVTGGGVSIVDGSSIAIGTQVALTGGTAGIIAPALSTRKVATIQNKTGQNLFVGDPTVTTSGATEGIKYPPDAIFQWRNTGALYGIVAANGNVSRTEET